MSEVDISLLIENSSFYLVDSDDEVGFNQHKA